MAKDDKKTKTTKEKEAEAAEPADKSTVDKKPVVPGHNASKFGNPNLHGRQNSVGRINNVPRRGLGNRGK